MDQIKIFREMLLRNNEEELIKYIKENGKPRKPVSPVFFILPKEVQEPLEFIERS